MRCRSRLARGMRLVRPRRGRSMQAPSIDPARERLAQQGGRRSPLTSPSTAPRREAPNREAPYDARERIHARLVRRRRARSAPVWDEIFTTDPTDRQLLWIDITGDVEPTDAEELAKRFALGRRTWGALQTEVREPAVRLHGKYLHARIAAEPSARDPASAAWLDVIAARNVAISQHPPGDPVHGRRRRSDPSRHRARDPGAPPSSSRPSSTRRSRATTRWSTRSRMTSTDWTPSRSAATTATSSSRTWFERDAGSRASGDSWPSTERCSPRSPHPR